MTESSAIFKETINKQVSDFFSFCRIHLKYRERKSQRNVFDYCSFSIHLLRIDMIRFHRRTWLQAKKRKENQISSRHINASDTNHSESIQIHLRHSIRNWISFTFNSTTARRIHLRCTTTNNHQFHLRTYTQSKKIIRSSMNARSNSALKNSIRSTKFTAQIRNQIRHDIQKKHNQFRKSNLFLNIFLMTIVEDHHSFNRRKSRRNSWSNHKRQLFSDIHEWQWHRK